MAVNFIVTLVTLLISGFALVWILKPKFRPWMEAPKYRVMLWDQFKNSDQDRYQEH